MVQRICHNTFLNLGLAQARPEYYVTCYHHTPDDTDQGYDQMILIQYDLLTIFQIGNLNV